MSGSMAVNLPEIHVGGNIYFSGWESSGGDSTGSGDFRYALGMYNYAMVSAAARENISNFYITPTSFSPRGFVVESPFGHNLTNPGRITEAQLTTDNLGNTYYALSSSATPVDLNNLIRISGIQMDIEGPFRHRYEEKVTVCYTSNPDCTPANVFNALKQRPAPFVYKEGGVNTGDINVVPFLGYIRHIVNAEDSSVINVTAGLHILHPGLVYQTLYKDGEAIGVRTIGIGSGYFGKPNEALSPLVWGQNSLAIQEQYLANTGQTDIYRPIYSYDSFGTVQTGTSTPAIPENTSVLPKGFDPMNYLAGNLDVARQIGSVDAVTATNHYIDRGRFENKSHNSFNGLEYIASNRDLITALGADSWRGALHYLNQGSTEGRLISFKGLEYIASNSDLIRAFSLDANAASIHYITQGYLEGRQTHSFDPLKYIASYGDLIRHIGNNPEAGLRHYIEFGYNEGRSVTFNPSSYSSNNSDVARVFGNDLLTTTIHYIISGYFEGRDNGSGRPLASPVILDLDGNGIDLALNGTSQVKFDIMGTGSLISTAWSGPRSGMLVIDLNTEGNAGSDGHITHQHEVDFWAYTNQEQAINSDIHPSDMKALRQVFDTNHNGLLDRGDERWTEFRVWQDINQNGISETGELKTLADWNIMSIGVISNKERQHFSDGSIIQGTSQYTLVSGETRTAADVQLAYGIIDNNSVASVMKADINNQYTLIFQEHAGEPDTIKVDFSHYTVGQIIDLTDESFLEKIDASTNNILIHVVGSENDDVIIAGIDNRISGGGGADIFNLASSTGLTIVEDFGSGRDRIYFGDIDANDLDNIISQMSQIGNDTYINKSDENIIVLEGISADKLGYGNFLLS